SGNITRASFVSSCAAADAVSTDSAATPGKRSPRIRRFRITSKCLAQSSSFRRQGKDDKVQVNGPAACARSWRLLALSCTTCAPPPKRELLLIKIAIADGDLINVRFGLLCGLKSDLSEKCQPRTFLAAVGWAPRLRRTGIMEYRGLAGVPYSGLMLAARITLPHFSISSAMSFPKSAGEPGSGVLPKL